MKLLVVFLVLLYVSRPLAALAILAWFTYVLWRVLSYQPRKPMDIKKRADICRDVFSKNKIPQEIDAIIVGSGAGGLYTAAFLAKAGKTVLVLEQHYIAGGATHTFEERGYEFDTGLHYLNNYKILGPFLDLVTDEPIKFAKMGKEEDGYLFDQLFIDDIIFNCKEGTWWSDLKKLFPKETDAIDRVRTAVNQSQAVIGLHLVAITMPKFVQRLLHWILPKTWWVTLAKSGPELVGEFTKDPKLASILLGRYGNIGGPPQEVPFALAVAVGEAFSQDGGAYPAGGAGAIARGLIPVIEKSGGRVLVRAPVEEILVKNNKAYGVRVKGTEILAPLIISGAGAWNTFARLLSPKWVEPRILEELKKATPSVSHVYAFIGLKGSQEELKLPSSNYWIIDAPGPDYDITKASTSFVKAPESGALTFFFGFPSAKDPLYNEKHPGKSVCLTFGETTIAAFEKWKESEEGKRDPDYVTYKKLIGERLVHGVLTHFPQLKDKIDFVDYATPLTNCHYLNSAAGESLGVRLNMYRCTNPEMDFLRPKTDIDGLFLTGQDAAIPGVFGAIVGGLLTAQVIMGPLPIIPFIRHYDFYSRLYPTLYRTCKHFIQSKNGL